MAAPGAELPPSASAPGTVRRRHVFYLAGFDPQGPAHYHRLYAAEAARQARVSGYTVEVGPRRRTGAASASWDVVARFGHEEVRTCVEFLRWDDIVRAHWPRSRWAVMGATLATTARLVADGVLWRVLQTSWPAFAVLVLPPALVLVLAGGVAASLWAGAALAGSGWGWGWGWGGSGAAAAAVAALGLALVALFGRWAEQRVQMAWLMRSTRFILRQARGEVPELERRLDEFAALVGAAWRGGADDEVLVVGHSSGTMLAASVVARVFTAGAAPPGGAPLSLLTLGQCIPILSYQPAAQAFRAELAALAGAQALDWVDFTAPPDGCCFALVDPTAVCRPPQAVPSTWKGPKRLSPRFSRLFTPGTYAALRRDKYRCHFQYLMASELPGDYDYFAITAGPQRLAARHAAQASVEDFRDFQCFGGVR